MQISKHYQSSLSGRGPAVRGAGPKSGGGWFEPRLGSSFWNFSTLGIVKLLVIRRYTGKKKLLSVELWKLQGRKSYFSNSQANTTHRNSNQISVYRRKVRIMTGNIQRASLVLFSAAKTPLLIAALLNDAVWPISVNRAVCFRSNPLFYKAYT